MKQKMKVAALVCAILCMATVLFGCNAPSDRVDYAKRENWAVLQQDADKPVDVFFVGPTVYDAENEAHRMPLEDEDAKKAFVRAVRMQDGIYTESCRMYAPYYRQAAVSAYEMGEGEREIYISAAYEDVSEAFGYYLEHYNDGRPVVLAGFSQGADHCIRLMAEYAKDETTAKKIVAVYAIGWSLTEEFCEEYPWVKPAQGELDLGSVVVFDAEAVEVESSLVVPRGSKTYSINPLNWRTDETKAEKTEHLGARFVDGEGKVNTEIPAFCGAYIDPQRGTLKVTGIEKSEYPAGIALFGEGEYHLYDYQFFYNNLKQNVNNRCEAYLAQFTG